MTKSFREIPPSAITDNPFTLIGTDWMLVTAGTADSWNTMTASWGGLGVLWNKPVCFCFIRPSRYTWEFMERSTAFTLSFFEESYRSTLNFCGSRSGRDVNKAAETGLTVQGPAAGPLYFAEARLVIECTKLYFQDIDPGNFLNPEIEDNYPQKDYHRMYIGEITRCLIK
ncbi:MAG: flavin reductase family protein [Spirochaetes bacterium]|nr:MAG: flavin reductase family protein [Spirochaetota bacterium]